LTSLHTEDLLLLPAEESLAQAVLDYYLRNREFLSPFEPLREESFYTLEHQKEALAAQRGHY